MQAFFKILLPLFFACLSQSQTAYQFSIFKTVAECAKASASLEITGTNPGDTITINWSKGQQDVYAIDGLDGGNYWVHIDIKSKADTIIFFTIDTEECKIGIGNLITPNGDGHNDVLKISNVQSYPNFEFEVYNKWGQKVHSQKSDYIPWDGKGNGIELPDGTYYYIFFYDASNKKKMAKGDVTILH